MGERMFRQVRADLLSDVQDFIKPFLQENSMKSLNAKSTIQDVMFDDWLGEHIINYYRPMSLTELLAWSQEEPMLLGMSINVVDDSCSLMELIVGNMADYLKDWVYQNIRQGLK